MNNTPQDDTGFFGILLTAVSWLTAGAAFIMQNITYVPTILSCTVSVLAIIYYKKAIKKLNK